SPPAPSLVPRAPPGRRFVLQTPCPCQSRIEERGSRIERNRRDPRSSILGFRLPRGAFFGFISARHPGAPPATPFPTLPARPRCPALSVASRPNREANPSPLAESHV